MLKMTKAVYDGVIEHLKSDTSIELCGILAGNGNVVTKFITMTNADNSIDHFSFEQKEHFSAIKELRKDGLKMLASYHSHPETPSRPSEEDIRLANDPSIEYVIVSLCTDEPVMKSFAIKSKQGEKTVSEEPIVIIDEVNAALADKSPVDIVKWCGDLQGENLVLTTNFRPYEVCVIHAVTQVLPEIPVVWIDHGYNTPDTYKSATETIEKFNLNVHLFAPHVTSNHRQAVMGGIPSLDDQEAHDKFTHEVKLEPFNRAMAEHKPTVWFTGLRKGQTALRDSLDIVVPERGGMLKVNPFYHFDDDAMEAYRVEHGLEHAENYFDPTKVHGKRECGLHTQFKG